MCLSPVLGVRYFCLICFLVPEVHPLEQRAHWAIRVQQEHPEVYLRCWEEHKPPIMFQILTCTNRMAQHEPEAFNQVITHLIEPQFDWWLENPRTPGEWIYSLGKLWLDWFCFKNENARLVPSVFASRLLWGGQNLLVKYRKEKHRGATCRIISTKMSASCQL